MGTAEIISCLQNLQNSKMMSVVSIIQFAFDLIFWAHGEKSEYWSEENGGLKCKNMLRQEIGELVESRLPVMMKVNGREDKDGFRIANTSIGALLIWRW